MISKKKIYILILITLLYLSPQYHSKFYFGEILNENDGTIVGNTKIEIKGFSMRTLSGEMMFRGNISLLEKEKKNIHMFGNYWIELYEGVVLVPKSSGDNYLFFVSTKDNFKNIELYENTGSNWLIRAKAK